MDWSKHAALSERWQRASRAYVAGVNDFVARGLRDGWDAAGEPPKDDRDDIAKAVFDVAREANDAGAWRELRAHFAPAHEPFVSWLGERAVGIGDALWVDDAHVTARIGPSWEPIGVALFGEDGSCEVLAGVNAVGRSPDRRFFGTLGDDGIEVREGFRGKVVTRLPAPTGREGWPREVPETPRVEGLHVFPSGATALVVRHDGLFLSSSDGVTRLYPDAEEIAAILGDDDEELAYDMIHGAISPDGLIAFGHQSSQHAIMKPTGEYVAWFGPIHSSYPHHAAFSPDGAHAIFNSCHFYNGVTIRAAPSDFASLRLKHYQEDRRLPTIEKGARVYASSFLRGAFLLGDANGYVHAVTPDGTRRWRHFCGSTIGGLDVSPDGKKLAVATYAGYLQIVDLNQPSPDPFQIGTASHRERIRFIHWKDAPLLRW